MAVHGWAGNQRTFRPLAQHVPEDSVLYSVDLPGYGLSPKPAAWTLAAMADALADVMGDVSREPVTLLGYCGGGNLAMMAALRVPERVARLVLIDPFAYMPLYFKVFTWGEFGRRAYRSTFANPLGRYFTNAALRKKRTGESSLTKSFVDVDHDFIVEVLRAFREVPHWDTFAGLTMPIDLVYGERSFAAVKQSAAIWKTVWPQARCYELANAGHSPLVEATEELAAIAFQQTAHSKPRAGTQPVIDTAHRRALTH